MRRVITTIILVLMCTLLGFVGIKYASEKQSNSINNSSIELSSSSEISNENSSLINNYSNKEDEPNDEIKITEKTVIDNSGNIILFKDVIHYECQELDCETEEFQVTINGKSIYKEEIINPYINYYNAIGNKYIVFTTICGLAGVYSNCGDVKVIDYKGKEVFKKEKAGIISTYRNDEYGGTSALDYKIENNKFIYYSCVYVSDDENYIVTNEIIFENGNIVHKEIEREKVYFCSAGS